MKHKGGLMEKTLIFILAVTFALLFSSITHAQEITSPVAGDRWELGSRQNITWSSGTIDERFPVKLELYRDGAIVGDIVRRLTIGIRSYEWTVGQSTAGIAPAACGYTVRLAPDRGGGSFPHSVSFCIDTPGGPEPEPSPPPPTPAQIIHPSSAGNYVFGSALGIIWSTSPNEEERWFTVELYRDGSKIGVIARNISSRDHTLDSWRVGNYIGGTASAGCGYSIRLLDYRNSELLDESERFCIVVQADITSPTQDPVNIGRPEEFPAPLDWLSGSSHDIKWTTDNLDSTTLVNLVLVYFDNTRIGNIAKNISGQDGMYRWTVGEFVGSGSIDTECKYYINLTSSSGIHFDRSAFFCIRSRGQIKPDDSRGGGIRNIRKPVPPEYSIESFEILDFRGHTLAPTIQQQDIFPYNGTEKRGTAVIRVKWNQISTDERCDPEIVLRADYPSAGASWGHLGTEGRLTFNNQGIAEVKIPFTIRAGESDGGIVKIWASMYGLTIDGDIKVCDTNTTNNNVVRDLKLTGYDPSMTVVPTYPKGR
jgi:hypothetical protein